MIKEKLNFENRGLVFDHSFENKNRKPLKKSGLTVGECFTAHAGNFERPIDCKILKLYDYSAMVGITATRCREDFAKSVELKGKTIVSLREFMCELKGGRKS